MHVARRSFWVGRVAQPQGQRTPAVSCLFGSGFEKLGPLFALTVSILFYFFFPALARLKVRAPQNILAALATLDTTSICLFKK